MRLSVSLKLTIVIFGFVLNMSDEIRYIPIASTKYIFQDKLYCVCCNLDIATTSTDECLANIFRIPRNIPGRVFVRDV